MKYIDNMRKKYVADITVNVTMHTFFKIKNPVFLPFFSYVTLSGDPCEEKFISCRCFKVPFPLKAVALMTV